MWQVSICSQLVISSWVSSHLTAWFSVPASWIPPLFFFSPPFFPPCFSVVFLYCVVSWFQSLTLAEEHLCPLLAVAFICFLLQKLSVVFFSKRNQSLSVDRCDLAFCQHLLGGVDANFCISPSSASSQRSWRWNLTCFLFIRTDPEGCRETQSQLGAEAAWAPKHTGTEASLFHKYTSCLATCLKMSPSGLLLTDIGEIKQELLYLLKMITDINTEANICCNHVIRYTAEICFN